MKVVMTLLVRNEADIIDAQIAFHLNAGVDFVIATDNGSEDGTIEILERYARVGYLHLIHEPGENMGLNQVDWVGRMARLASSEFNADWVINSDADEFWCSRRGSLRSVLQRIPSRFSTARAYLRNFVPRPGDGRRFAERMTVRLVPAQLPPEGSFLAHPFHAQEKVVHRGNPNVAVSAGNHDAAWDGSVDLRGWWPLEVLHFPIRSVDQCEQKWRNYERYHYVTYDALRQDGPREFFESHVIDEEGLVEGLAGGWLAVDTRLRDALAALQDDRRSDVRDGSEFPLPSPARPNLVFPSPTLSEDAVFAADVSVGSERDTFVRTGRRLDDLERRITVAEHRPWRRVLGNLDRRQAIRRGAP